jgi:hypothetical protein
MARVLYLVFQELFSVGNCLTRVRGRLTAVVVIADQPLPTGIENSAERLDQIRKNSFRRYIQNRMSQSTKSTAAPWMSGS